MIDIDCIYDLLQGRFAKIGLAFNPKKRTDMTIKIEDNIDDLTAISLVKQVIEQGKISNNGNSYCYLTLFGDIFVETRQYRKSPCFRVYKK